MGCGHHGLEQRLASSSHGKDKELYQTKVGYPRISELPTNLCGICPGPLFHHYCAVQPRASCLVWNKKRGAETFGYSYICRSLKFYVGGGSKDEKKKQWKIKEGAWNLTCESMLVRKLQLTNSRIHT